MKIGTIEIDEELNKELEKRYFEKDEKFIVTYRTVYQLHYSINSGLSATKIYYKRNDLPLLRKGRFIITNAKHVNDLLDIELVED